MTVNRLVLAAALAYGVPGLALTFGPDAVLARAGASAAPIDVWLAHLLGATLLGLAFLNWVQRHALMGGIYGRPLLLANLMFVTVAFFASARVWFDLGGRLIAVATVVLGLLAIAFGRSLFRTPTAVTPTSSPET